MRLIALLITILVSTTLHAALPDEMLADPALEARARAISQEVRCVVCQNQSIDDSSADLARDLRLIVREQLVAGKSDDQVRAYLVQRYGTYVLLRPPLSRATLLLWFGPAALALLAALGVYAALFRRRAAAAVPPALSQDEQQRAQAVLEQL